MRTLSPVPKFLVYAGILALMGIVMVAGVVQAMTPQKNYCCPICGECFYDLESLRQHFEQAHPSEPISITWES